MSMPSDAHNAAAVIGIRERFEHDVSGLGTGSDEIQHDRQEHAGPFGYVGPNLFAGMQDYVTFHR